MLIINQEDGRAQACRCRWIQNHREQHDLWLERFSRLDRNDIRDFVVELDAQEQRPVLSDAEISYFDMLEFADAHDVLLSIRAMATAIQLHYIAVEMRPFAGVPQMPETKLVDGGTRELCHAATS